MPTTAIKAIALIVLGLLVCAAASAAEDLALKVTVNRTQVYLGESFILETKVTGSSQPGEPDLSQIANCRIKPLGSRNISNYSITIINGKLAKQGFTGRMASYEITPLAAGSLTVGPVSVVVGGRTLVEPGPTVTVTDIEKQDLVLISVTSSRETVLVDEQFDVILRILIRRLPAPHENTEPLFTDNPPDLSAPYLDGEGLNGLTAPDLQRILHNCLVSDRNQPGLAINNITVASSPFDFGSLFQGLSGESRKARFALSRRIANQDGKSYFEYSLSLPFTPKDEGNYVFGPVVFKGSVPVEVTEQGHARGVPVFAVGPAGTVRVVPPPEEGQPPSFSGALGTNLTIAAALDTTSGNIGDPLRLTLTLSGQIRFDKMLPPKLALQTNIVQRFDVYDNTVQTIQGTNQRQYVYTLRPTHAGSFDLPPIEVSFYDTQARSYKTAYTRPIPLVIQRGTEVTAGQIQGHTNRPREQKKEFDLAAEKPASIRAVTEGARPGNLLGRPWLLTLGATGPAMYLMAVLGGLVRQHSGQWKLTARRRKALASARRRLRAAERLARKDPIKSGREIRAGICQYLADRLEAPSACLTPSDARRRLADAAVSASVINSLVVIFERHFNAGFSKQAPGHDLNNDINQTRNLLENIDRETRE